MVKFKYKLHECNNIYFECTYELYIGKRLIGKCDNGYVSKTNIKGDLKKLRIDFIYRFSKDKRFKQEIRDILEAQLILDKLTE